MNEVFNETAAMTMTYLGGKANLQTMIGAHGFTVDEKGTLTFQFKGSRKANVAQFRLDADDTYTIKFMHYNRRTCLITDKGEMNGLYFDQLVEVFERFTGLYLSL